MCDSFHPPNDWNCRCSAMQVRKGKCQSPHPNTSPKNTLSPSAPAVTLTPLATLKTLNAQILTLLSLARIFVPDNEVCATCKLVRACYDGKTKESELQRIEENRKLYDRLSKDKRYKDVEFNPTTGALKATHVGHNEGSDEGGRLEKKLVNQLYSCGHSIILADEQKKGRNGNVLTSLDMILDGVRMDIKSITKK